MIFNAVRDDPNFLKSQAKVDVVTDGNHQCNRKLMDDEKKHAKTNLPGRPRTKKPKKNKKATSRCKAVAHVEEAKLARTQS
jgi:hypothetical protein